MQLNLEIGKLYTAQGFFVLKQSSGDWHSVRDGEILMPIEIIHGKQDYTKLSIKLLSENGMIGWFQTYQEILSNYFILPQKNNKCQTKSKSVNST